MSSTYMRFALCCAVLLLLLPSVVLAEQVTIQYMYLAEAEATEQRVAALVEAFEQAHPNIKIDRIRVVSNHRNRLVTMMAAGMMPDVLALDMNFAVEFGSELVLTDLMPLVEKSSNVHLEDYAPVALETFMHDGKLFALPTTSTPTAYIYNADLIDQLGLVQPAELFERDDWTWSAFRETAMRMTEKTGDGTFERLGSTLHLPRVWIWSNGGEEFDDPKWPTESRYHESEAVEALEFLQNLVWQDEAMATIAYQRMTDLVRPRLGVDEISGFLGGRIGMISRWISFLPQLTDSIFTAGIVPIPKGPSPAGRYATDLGIWGVSISRHTEHPEEAWLFASFMASETAAELCGAQPGCVPARPTRLTWIPDHVLNPEIVPLLLSYGNMRVVAQEREQLLRMVNEEVARVMNNEVPAASAGHAIRERIAAFLAQ